jgi:hypothetical protein
VFADFGIHIKCACAILLSATCQIIQDFSTLSYKRHDFRKKKYRFIEQEMCVLTFFKILFEIFHIVRRIRRDKIKMCIGLYVKHTFFLSYYSETWNVSTAFEKYSNTKFHKNPSSVSLDFPNERTVRRTDMKKLIIAICINESKKMKL